MADFNSYTFMCGECDIAKVKELHDLVVELKEDFEKNKAIRTVLLNRTELKPTTSSFLDIKTPIFQRTTTALLLTYANALFARLTTPPIALPQTKIQIYQPGALLNNEESELELKTKDGHNHEVIEHLQHIWKCDAANQKTVREYIHNLNKTFDEFNLQFVVDLIHYRRHDTHETKKEAKIKERIDKVYNPEAYTELDSAYYDRARSFFHITGNIAAELNKTELGRFFVLTTDELSKGHSA